MRIIITLLLLTLGFGLVAQDDDDMSLSLEEAIETALDNDYALRIARQNLEVARNNNAWGAAGRLPNVNAFLNLDNSLTDQSNPASFLRELQSLSNGFTPGIEASWTVWDGNRIPLTKRQLETRQDLNANQVEGTREEVVQAVVMAYYQVLIQQEQLRVLEEVLRLSRDRLAYEKVREEYGQAGTFDLLQTQDAYLNDSIAWLQQYNTLDAAHRNLNLAMGMDNLSPRFSLITSLDFTPPTYEPEELQQNLLDNNKALRSQQINRELARLDTRLQETERKPSVNISAGGNYNYNVSNGEGTFASGDLLDLDNIEATRFNYFLNVSATYNLYNGENRRRNIQNAQMQEVVAQYQVDDLKRQLNTQLANTLAEYNNQLRTVQLSESLLENARRNMELAEERFRGGLINSFDYRSIQLAFINASQARLNALFNLKTTETELLRLTGQLP